MYYSPFFYYLFFLLHDLKLEPGTLLTWQAQNFQAEVRHRLKSARKMAEWDFQFIIKTVPFSPQTNTIFILTLLN